MIKAYSKILLSSILKSYSQIFFSGNKIFSIILIVVSFFDYLAGICGLASILTANIVGLVLGFDRTKISSGIYSFNALLVGLGIGIYYDFSWMLILVLVLSAIFTFFISVVLEGVLGKYALPYLSIPFLFAFWAFSLASREFHALGISSRGIYNLNELYTLGGKQLVDLYYWWNSIPIEESIKSYFISLGAIFFQYNVLSGMLIAIGILIYSRIAFSLSLIGFYGAYFFYKIIGAQITEITYTYIGFNYILSAIAVGGFFLIPSSRSYFWTIVLIPIVAIITLSSSIALAVFGLSIYSLPFNIIVLIFIYVLKLRVFKSKKLSEVQIQYNSPEKNLYLFDVNYLRFSNNLIYFPIKLPFIGEWTVLQAHNGQYTHKDDWKHAWDFVITDDGNNQFRENGQNVEDYYAFKKNIIAPADGYVNEIIDFIDDNKIGDVNLKNNWGNTIIIKHTEYLYSKISHIKQGSFKVSKGDYVKQGQIIALCGNSGRSPYPHIHFQLQATPFVGSKTIDYPICTYIKKDKKDYIFNSYSRPKLNDKIFNIAPNELMKKAFGFIPGQKLKFEIIQNEKTSYVDWEIHVDSLNRSYIWCRNSNSISYFTNDGTIFYFKHFEGDKESLLFHFTNALYRINLGFYNGIEMRDIMPVNLMFSAKTLFFHDFVAPFKRFLKALYVVNYESIDDEFNSEKITLKSKVEKRYFNKALKQYNYNIEIDTEGVKKLEVISKSKEWLKASLVINNSY